MSYRFADCQGFAGGMAVGATQAGFQLVGKTEKPGGFGLPLMEANRRFLGDSWQAQIGDPVDWEPVTADVVVGTPPCAAFSGMSVGTAAHGVHSSINNCMRDLIGYAVKVRPLAVVMESVGQAYSQGITLMRELNETLNAGTGLRYHATHVLQNNWLLGGATKRRRYFLVLSRVPFGVEFEPPTRLATVGDAIGDLTDLSLSWEPQLYQSPPTWWSLGQVSASTGKVDGHHLPVGGVDYQKRVMDLVTGDRAVPWPVGDSEEEVLRRYYETNGELPESWHYDGKASRSGLGHLTRDKQLIEKGFKVGGFSRPRHWPWDEPGRVINGAGPFMVWHPHNRFATHREVARLMGFPDDYLIEPCKDVRALGSFWGKGTSVHPARWVMTWLRQSLDGNPGSLIGQEQADGSRLIDVSTVRRPVTEVSLPA